MKGIKLKLTGKQLIEQCRLRVMYWQCAYDAAHQALAMETKGRSLVGGEEYKPTPVIERLLGVAEPSGVEMSRERAIYAARRLTHFLGLADTIDPETTYTLRASDLAELEWRFDAAMDPLKEELRHL